MAKKLLAMISTKGKTKEQISQEVKEKLTKKKQLKDGKITVKK